MDHLQDLKNVSAVSPLLNAAVQNKIALKRMNFCEVRGVCTVIGSTSGQENPACYYVAKYDAWRGRTDGAPFSLVWEMYALHITSIVLELPLLFDCSEFTRDMISNLTNIRNSNHTLKNITIRPGWDHWKRRWNNGELPLEDFGRVDTAIRRLLSALIVDERVESIYVYGYYDFHLWGHYERHEGIYVITEA